jgi:hypothetical protein
VTEPQQRLGDRAAESTEPDDHHGLVVHVREGVLRHDSS